MKILRVFSAALFAALCLGTAQAGPYDNLVTAEVLHGAATDRGTHIAAVKLTMKPGWKTYWRSPGDAGIPPDFSWAGSRNLGAVAVHWPVPKVYQDYGLRTIGYKNQVILPVEITPKSAGQVITLKGRLELGVCKDICVPARVALKATLSPVLSSDMGAINDALSSRPKTAREAGVGKVTCRVEPISDGLRLSVVIPMRSKPNDVGVIELPGQEVWVSEPQVQHKGGTMRLTSDIVPTSGNPLTLNRQQLRFTVIGNNRAIDIRGCERG